MTSFEIKVLAALLMVIDHVGIILFPNQLAFRYIGRLSFPLFAWLLGQGEKHTKDVKAYLLRLITFALISQPIYFILFRTGQLNILFTLAIGLVALFLPKLIGSKYLVWVATATVAQVINAEYGAYGVATIILMSRFEPTSVVWWMGWEILNLSTLLMPTNFAYFQGLAMLAPLILVGWNSKQGRKFRLFYYFYPAHIVLLYVMDWLLKLSTT